jgi:GUN4-like
MSEHNLIRQKNRNSWVSIFVLLALSVQSCQLKLDKRQKIDYNPLIKQLKAENWRAADAETLQLMLKISDRTVKGWLSQADVQRLPCEALVQMDRLWNQHSQGKFGFNQQRLIWLSVGGTVGQYSPDIAEKFGSRVGWRSDGQWRNYNRLNFSIQAPQGHLPATTGNGVSGSIWGGVAAIAQRLQYCRHEVAIAIARNDYYADCKRKPHEQRCRLKEAAERWGDTLDWGGKGIPSLLERLEQALAHKQWITADKITKTLLDRYRRANWAQFHQPDSHQLIPCYLLKAVDDLWMQYSQDRFGLTAQASVLSELKILPLEQARPNYQNTAALHVALGWNQSSNSAPAHRPYNLAFNGVESRRVPKGFYPYDMGYSYYTYGSGYVGEWRFYLNPACGFNR